MLDLTPFNLQPSLPILAGVSGGADSLCLLGMLHEAGWEVVAAHFDHQLRPESAAEAEHVHAIAARLGVLFVTSSANVAEFAAANGLSIEEAARKLRYRFLFAAARQHGAQAVAVAHTADDQVETVLMNFMRGSGLSGLKGILPRVILPEFDSDLPLIRPLLRLWRPETESYCNEHGLTFVVDPSNTDQAYLRNKLRHSLIPELETYNPQFKQGLLRTVLALQGDHELLAELISKAWESTVAETGEGFFAFKQLELSACSPALRRNLIRKAAFELLDLPRDVNFAALERASAFAAAPNPGQVDLADGLYLFQQNNLVYVALDKVKIQFSAYVQLNEEFLIKPGNFELSNGWHLSVDEIKSKHLLEQAKANTDPFTAWLDADLTAGRLRVRKFRAGDSFEPLGMPGQRVKLSDLFTNLKIPKRVRKNYPLLVVDEEVAWVVGLRLAHRFRITENSRHAVRLVVNQKT